MWHSRSSPVLTSSCGPNISTYTRASVAAPLTLPVFTSTSYMAALLIRASSSRLRAFSSSQFLQEEGDGWERGGEAGSQGRAPLEGASPYSPVALG